MTARAALVGLALAGCAQPADRVPCSGAAGLHVIVDLSQGLCPHLTDVGVTIQLGATTLTRTDALHTSGDPAHQSYEYTFAWPAGVADGSPLTVEVDGSGEGAILGSGVVADTAHVRDCEVVSVAAACRSDVPDAGP